MYLNDYARSLKDLGYRESVKPNWYVYVKREDGKQKVAVIIFNNFNARVQSSQNLKKIQEIIDNDPVLLPFDDEREYLFLILVSSKRYFRSMDRTLNVMQISEDGKCSISIHTSVFDRELRELKLSRVYERSLDKSVSYNESYGYGFAYITTIVMVLCVIVFIKKLNPEVFGASYEIVRSCGHYQNLLTASFMHSGLLHLTGNIFTLAVIGLSLEKRMGHLSYLALILTSAVFTNLVSVSWFYIEGQPQLITVGLSGVVFAVLGADIVYGLAHGERIIYSAILVGINLLFGMLNPVVNNVAHIAGLGYGVWFMLIVVVTASINNKRLMAYIYKEKVKRVSA